MGVHLLTRRKCIRMSDYPPRAPYHLLNSQVFTLGAFFQIGYAAFVQEISDEKLMQLYANGDAKAFDQLYARHRAPLYRYFIRQVGNPTTANDLYQGAWEKIIKARGNYRSNAPFKVWMYRIAHNHLIDYFRRMRPADSLEPDTLSDSQPDPSQGAIESQQNELLGAGIKALPVEQRNTLLLQLETGLKIEEISRVTGVGRETVKSRLRYAVNYLKRSLVE
jgi:RNA polymerase sigma factor (sigma-70 family)